MINPMDSRFDRLATIQEAIDDEGSWVSSLHEWDIVGLKDGAMNGPGYTGSSSKAYDIFPGDENNPYVCDRSTHTNIAFIMCLACDSTPTTIAPTTQGKPHK